MKSTAISMIILMALFISFFLAAKADIRRQHKIENVKISAPGQWINPNNTISSPGDSEEGAYFEGECNVVNYNAKGTAKCFESPCRIAIRRSGNIWDCQLYLESSDKVLNETEYEQDSNEGIDSKSQNRDEIKYPRNIVLSR